MVNTDSLYIDVLSGVYNRRYLKEHQGEIESLIARKIPFSVVMVDIDHFRAINNTYGHLKGDEVIRDFAQFLRNTLRKLDTVIRYGGDEFLCIIPRTTKYDTETIYRRILKTCRMSLFGGLNITLSAGIASFPDDGQDLEGLLKIADQALYDVKRSGRDRIGTIQKKKIIVPMRTFIDRTEENEKLTGIVMDGQRLDAVVVHGIVGIGKTHLARHVLGNIKGKEIIWSDCLFFTEDIAYYPIREAIKYRIQRWGTEILSEIPLVYRLELGKLVSELTEGIGDKTEDLELVLDKYRMYEGIKKVLEIGEREKVVVIDNMQWIDRESPEVLRYLMRSLKNNPITFIFIYRTEEKAEIMRRFLTSVSREIDLPEIELMAFERAAVKESIKFIIGEEPKEELVEYVAGESGGIPFYIEEIMRVLFDKRYLTIQEDEWTFRAPEQEVVPKSIEDITMRKYRSLSKEAQKVLEIASVTGWFNIEIIKEITRYNEGEIVGLIDDIKKLGMAKSTRDRIGFSEEMSRGAIYKMVVEGIMGMDLHKRVAQYIEARNMGKESDVAEELAYHYYHAREKEKGVKCCIEAGDRAKEKYANQAAIRYYIWALELLEDSMNKERRQTRIDCLLKRAHVLDIIGDCEKALEDLEKSLRESKAIGDKAREAHTMLKEAEVYQHMARYKKAIEETERCRVIYQGIGDRKKTSESLNLIGIAHVYLGKNEKAMEFFKEALKISSEIGDNKGKGTLLNSIGNVYTHLGDLNSALKFYKESLAMAQDERYMHLMATSVSNIGVVYRGLGMYTRALQCYEDALKIYREIGSKLGEVTSCDNIGNVYCNLGEPFKGLKFYKSALKIAREIGYKNSEAASLINTGFLYISFGEYHKALEIFEDSLEIAREIGNKRLQAYALNGIGKVHDIRGDHGKAVQEYEMVQNIIKQTHVGGIGFINLFSLGMHYIMHNDLTKAREYIDQAYRIAEDSHSKKVMVSYLSLLCTLYLEEENLDAFNKTMKNIGALGKEVGTKSNEGEINLLLGRYYTKTKDFGRAEKHLKESLALYQGLGEKLNNGRVLYYFGELERIRGDDVKSREYIDKSLVVFKAIGAKAWQDKAERFLKEMPA